MSGEAANWTVRLTAAAEDDFRGIVRWTYEQFGEQQARVYAETLSEALKELEAGPEQVGVRARNDIAKGILSFHVARRGRKGRHFMMLRVADRGGRGLDVLRLLHDSMDLQLHLPPPDEAE